MSGFNFKFRMEYKDTTRRDTRKRSKKDTERSAPEEEGAKQKSEFSGGEHEGWPKASDV